MADKFITLSCQQCGGKIDVYDDMKRFACSFCGTEMMVQRRGNAVLLEKLTEVVAKAHISVDRASDEIETVRLTHEREKLLEKLTEMHQDFEKMIYIIAGLIVIFLGPLYWYHMKWLWVVLVLGGPIALAVYRFIKRHQAKTDVVQKEINGINARLEELKPK